MDDVFGQFEVAMIKNSQWEIRRFYRKGGVFILHILHGVKSRIQLIYPHMPTSLVMPSIIAMIQNHEFSSTTRGIYPRPKGV